MNKKKEIKYRLWSLKKARKDLLDEFEKWHPFYTIKWFLSKMNEIDTAIAELEKT